MPHTHTKRNETKRNVKNAPQPPNFHPSTLTTCRHLPNRFRDAIPPFTRVASLRFPPFRLDRAARYRALSRRAFFTTLERYFHMSERLTLTSLFTHICRIQATPHNETKTKPTLLNPRGRARGRGRGRVFVEPHRRGWLRFLSCRHAVARRGANLLRVSARSE